MLNYPQYYEYNGSTYSVDTLGEVWVKVDWGLVEPFFARITTSNEGKIMKLHSIREKFSELRIYQEFQKVSNI